MIQCRIEEQAKKLHAIDWCCEETLDRDEVDGVCVCIDLINLERADTVLFIIDMCTALNALPV